MNAGKAAVLVIGGMCIGAGLTTLVIKKKYEAYAEEEITSVRESYIKRIGDLEWLLEGKKESEDEVITPSMSVKVKTEVPMERVVPSNETLKKAYNKINLNPETVEGLKETVEQLGYSRKEETVKEDPRQVKKTKDVSDDTPYVISVQTFMDNEEGYDQMTLSYYAQDKVLVDDAEQIIEDVDSTVGYHNLHNFGVESENDDTVYIRNDKRGAEYEILRMDDAYRSAILGIDTWGDSPEPREPIKKFR